MIDEDYDQEDELSKKYNGRFPKEIIEETEDLNFVIYILQDKCKRLSKAGRLYSKIQLCIKHLEFLKDIDDKYLWLTRDYTVLKMTHESLCKEGELKDCRHRLKLWVCRQCKKSCVDLPNHDINVLHLSTCNFDMGKQSYWKLEEFDDIPLSELLEII